jgi:IS30 family transposase
MGTQYSHLSNFERCRLFEWYHYQKKSIREVSRLLNRSHSTISRELKRNKYDYYVPTYYPHPAQMYYEVRVRERAKRVKLKSVEAQRYVADKLKLGWSPEIIAGRIKFDKTLPSVSHEAIYQYIYKNETSLIVYLARQHKKRKKKYPTRKTKTVWGQRCSILDRPDDINLRKNVGHWESDSVESSDRKCALNVLLERVSRVCHITKLSSKKALATSNAICKKLSIYPPSSCLSITYDNGSENTEFKKVEAILKNKSYFCEPYHSWEKGAVEQINGLIRRYYPKKTNFSKVSHQKLKKVEEQLNNRPRKCLGFKTPNEVYNELGGALPIRI